MIRLEVLVIIGYLPITTQMLLKEWKTAIILVEQEYKSIEGR